MGQKYNIDFISVYNKCVKKYLSDLKYIKLLKCKNKKQNIKSAL